MNHKIAWNKSSLKPVISKFLKINPFTIEELKYVPFSFWTYSDFLVPKDYENYDKTFKLAQEKEHEVYATISKDIVKRLHSPRNILKYTEDAISELLIVNESISSRRFSTVISELIDNDEMCNALLDNNSNKIENDFCIFLEKVFKRDPECAFYFLDRAFELKNMAILNSVAESFWWIFENQNGDRFVGDCFKRLFKHESESIRLSSLRGLRILVHQNKRSEAIKYIMDNEITSKKIAEGIFELVNPYCLTSDEFTDEQLSIFLEKIKDIEDINNHHIGELISVCGKRVPYDLVDMLLYRVESRRGRTEPFTALPYLGFPNLNLNLSEEKILQIYDRFLVSLKKEDADTFWLPNLFHNIAKRNYELTISYLTTLLKSDDIEVVGIGTMLIRKFNHGLIFTRQDLVRDLLKHGKRKGAQFFDEIRGGLFLLALPRSKQGTAGQPMPQDVALVENATTAIAKAMSDLERKFFTELKQYGEQEIALTMKRNQRMFDQ